MKGDSGGGRAGGLGDTSACGSSDMDDRYCGVSMGGRLPTLLLEPHCGIGEEGAGEPGLGLIGSLVERRTLTSGERNI